MNLEAISPPQQAPAGAAEPELGRAAALICRALVVIAILFVLVRALPILSAPLGRDQGTYLTIGQGLLEGKKLYRDLWDNKPPGIFIVYAGIAKLFGRVMWSAAVVDMLLLFVISYLLFRFTEPYLGRGGAAVAVMVHASLFGDMRYYWIAQPETFQVACVLAAYSLVARPGRRWKASCAGAGLLFGCACWLKYNAIAFFPLLVVLPYLETRDLDQKPPRLSLSISWRDWSAKFVFLLAGLVAAIGIVLAWIVFKGAWPAMRETQFEVMPRYAAMGIERNPHYLLTGFYRTNRCLGAWNLWAALVGILTSWLRRDLKRFAPILFAAFSALASVVMQVRFHDYYFQTCYPFFAVIWAYLAVSVFEGSRALAGSFRKRGWRLAAGLVWLVFAQAVFWPLPEEFNKLTLQYEQWREWWSEGKAFYANYPAQLFAEHLDGQLAVVNFLDKNTSSHDAVYVWSANCAIYFLAGRQPPTRFVSNLGIISLWSLPSWRDELMRDLRNAQPRFIVVSRQDSVPAITYVRLDSETYIKTFPEFDSFITRNYKPVADFDSFVVYGRSGKAPFAAGALGPEN
jgi:hypothetical protein